MWLVIRLAFATAAFFYRYKVRWLEGGGDPMGKTPGGRPLYFRESKHKGRVVSIHLRVQVAGRATLVLKRESGLDRFLKGWGLAREIQTRDERFDRSVYVVGDHPGLGDLFRDRAELRAALARCVGYPGRRREIGWDGDSLEIRSWSETSPAEDWPALLDALADAVQATPSLAARRRTFDPREDPFLTRALLLEAVAWTVLGYAAGAGLGLLKPQETTYVDGWALAKTGLGLGLGLSALLVAVAVSMLRGSSRSPRVLVEICLVLLIGGPAAGPFLVSDLNTRLDRTPVTEVAGEVARRHHHHHRRGPDSYHLEFAPTAFEIGGAGHELPTEVEVLVGIYDGVAAGDTVVFGVRGGALGLPWIESRRIHLGAAP